MRIKLKTDLCVCGRRFHFNSGRIVEVTRQDKKNYYFETKSGEDYPKIKEVKVSKILAEQIGKMRHIEITEKVNGKTKVVFSADVDNLEISESRELIGLYKGRRWMRTGEEIVEVDKKSKKDDDANRICRQFEENKEIKDGDVPLEIVPSRFTKTIISFEDYSISNSYFTTMERVKTNV